jgi:hypothetical protein
MLGAGGALHAEGPYGSGVVGTDTLLLRVEPYAHSQVPSTPPAPYAKGKFKPGEVGLSEDAVL